MDASVFPFTSIVGQEGMKNALILNVIDPGIGGVLIEGEKGTAKSTAVRSLAHILPERTVVKGCTFGCDPLYLDRSCSLCRGRIERGEKLGKDTVKTRVIELPLCATEDRVAGTLDIEHALKTGEKRFEPGVLAQANGNILYVDEVNLLDDHLVDLLLDAAAMGVNHVEREGISFSHPSRFVLVGTMNPEEGELRPQLLDRFGLSVNVCGEGSIDDKVEIIKRRLRFDTDPEGYMRESCAELAELRRKITDAKERLANVRIDDNTLDSVVRITSHFRIIGHRADITMIKAARANAAFECRTDTRKEDVAAVAEMVLSHRIKRRPFESSHLNEEELEKCLSSI